MTVLEVIRLLRESRGDVPIPSGRSKRRIAQILAAEVSLSEESVPKETTGTENLSLHGTRVITVRTWQPGTHMLVTFLWDRVRSEERVACGEFAIGAELSGQVQAAWGT